MDRPTKNTPEDYARHRAEWLPEKAALIVIAESPPDSGKYFYNPSGRTTEPLFTALMESLCDGLKPTTKAEGLAEFRRRRLVLLDATYTQVDKFTKAKRNKCIVADFESLCARLDALDPGKHAPILLVKVNVCEILEPQLAAKGRTVLNEGRQVNFPSNGNQSKFRAQVKAILGTTGVRG